MGRGNRKKNDTPIKRVLKKLKMTPTLLTRELIKRGRISLKQSTVCRWGYPHPKGTGGYIPQAYHKDIMDIAKDRGVNLKADDLLFV